MPNNLYKYTRIDKEHPEWIYRIFTHQEIYFPSIPELNDPWESRPIYQKVNLKYKNVRKDLTKFLIPRDESISSKLRMIKHSQTASSDELNDLFLLSQQQLQEYLSSFEIYSLSATDGLNPLMWSHYSDSHRGLCLEFDSTRHYFSDAQKVNYSEYYPEIYLLEPDREKIVMEMKQKSLLTKSKYWAYEKEYRLISSENPECIPELNIRMPVKNNILKYNSNSLTGVIFGCQMDDKVRNKLIGLIHSSDINPKLYQAEMKKNKYELEKVLIS